MSIVWWTLLAVGILLFIAQIGYDAGERAERRRLSRPEFQEHWGDDEGTHGQSGD
jgi:hypothetical protein